MIRCLLSVGLGLTITLFLFGCASPPASAEPTASPVIAGTLPASEAAISGAVLGPDGTPLPGATVRVQGTVNQTLSDEEGSFTLVGLEQGRSVTVSAWKEGFYCAKVEGVTPPTSDIAVNMRLLQTDDNPDYTWVAPTGENSCSSCKAGVTQVWLDNDAHARSAVNPRFLTMYAGTDVEGNQSPLTRYASSRDYGLVPLRPDTSVPYYGPGYKLDFPDTAGNCAACHTPGAAIDAPYGVDPTSVSAVDEFGVHCDFCHKIADVRLDPATGLPYANMPGVLSMEIRRPFPEDLDRYQLFFGTFDDDNVPQEDTFLPLIKESAYCAPCHYGVFWDTVVYNSYGEWLESPYSSPSAGKTCQQCHMPSPTVLNGQSLTNVASGKGGIERDPLAIHAHTFPGAASQELLQNAVTLRAVATRAGDSIRVNVIVTNDQTGHHVPTDSPLRQLLLLVEARDANGEFLELLEGPTIPSWGGVGDPADGHYAGVPGRAYAKVLTELWTEVSPTGAYWNPTRIVSDNRLAAFESDSSAFAFEAPVDSPMRITVRLLFRRAYIELMEQKGWDVPDILMEEAHLLVD
jgi:hypothetical protein